MLGPDLKNSAVYTDFQDLAALRREAGQNGEQALQKTARQFEALFMQMMLKSMREAGGGEGLFDSEQSDLYRDMYDKQLSLHLTEQGEGIGLAKMLVQQLKGSLPASSPADSPAVPAGFAVPPRGPNRFALRPAPLVTQPAPAQASLPPASASFDSPQQFLATLAPHAQRAAERLGVDPRALLAQAALETGWGKSVIRRPDGASSHNLFNIKADHRWDGETVAKQTLEYRQGLAAREVSQFRAYDSLSQSFDDYVEFLRGSPRYAGALRDGAEAGRYLEALQEAGYATDPAYASKIKRILSSDVMASADFGLKNSSEGTLT